jgi:chemotaxis protein methyltransferase CheR
VTSTLAADLGAIRDVVRRTTGMDLTGIKDQQLERRVNSFCQRKGMASADLIAGIRHDPDLRDDFLDRLTINVTNLYRNRERWKDLEQNVLPDLGPRAKIWSAGCSTGAEAYSLAIACHRVGVAATIIGSDIDRASLAKARTGVYDAVDMREVPAEIERAHFTKIDAGWQVNREIAAKVRFEHRDLLNQPPPAGSFDLVVCRNVVIYFNDTAKEALHRKLAGTLRRGGYLFVGNAERVSHPADLELVGAGPQFYRKAP